MSSPSIDPRNPTNDPLLAKLLEPAPWRWRFSLLFGVTYGPLPVGLMIVLLAAIAGSV